MRKMASGISRLSRVGVLLYTMGYGAMLAGGIEAFDATNRVAVETTSCMLPLQFLYSGASGMPSFRLIAAPQGTLEYLSNGVYVAVPPDSPVSSGFWYYSTTASEPGTDTFTWEVIDGANTDTAIMTLLIVTNTPPVAQNQSLTLLEGTPKNLSLAMSDPDDGQSFTYTLTVPPAHGLLTYTSPGTPVPTNTPAPNQNWTYAPDSGYSGTDTFRWRVSDGFAQAEATYTLTVITNTPPVLYGNRMVCTPGSAVTNAARYVDPDTQTRTLQIVTPPLHGQATIMNLSLVYTPDPGFSGEDAFTYRLSDGISLSNTATNRVQVREPDARAGNRILLVVKDTLYTELSTEVDRLKQDLVDEGYTADISLWTSGSSSNLWALIKNAYENPGYWLEGVLLIGDLPRPQISAYHPAYSGYRTASTDMSLWNMNFYQTRDDVDVNDLRVWVGRYYAIGLAFGDEVTLLRRALDANHAARKGEARLPHDAYYYHAWSSYTYGPNLTSVWTSVISTNEVSTDGNRCEKRFLPSRTDITAGGADALVAGGDLFQETSHGNSDDYMYHRFTKADLFRLLAQQRYGMIESCTVGNYGGIVNHHILTRGGGMIFAVGGSEINYVGDFQLAAPDAATAGLRAKLATGEAWGSALIRNYAFKARSRTIYHGDLSMPVMASPPNAVPVIETFSRTPADTVYPGQPVTFSIAVADIDAAATNSPHVAFEHQVEWFMNGYDAGRLEPTSTTLDTQGAGWTNVLHMFPTSGTYTVRAEVMDEWQARGWREMTVTVSDYEPGQVLLTLDASAGGNVTPALPTVVTQAVPVAIAAEPQSGYQFAYWSVTAGDAEIDDIHAATTTATLAGHATIQALFTDASLGIESAASSVTIPEGETAGFQVRLTAPPDDNIQVTVTRTGGDAGFSVQQGNTLLFTPTDWHAWQTVTLASQDDDNAVAEEAEFTLAASGLDTVTVTAIQQERHLPLTLEAGAGGSVSPHGERVAVRDQPVPVTATAATGYAFVQWTNTAGTAGIGNIHAPETTVTLNSAATVRALFSLNTVGILASTPYLAVPPEGSASFRLVLSAQPTGSVAVTVTRTDSSPAAITVDSDATLEFTPANWYVWQPVRLSAGPNTDGLRDSACFACEGAWGASNTVIATESRQDTLEEADTDGDGLPDIQEELMGRNPSEPEAFQPMPVIEHFEADTLTPGPLHGRNGWVANPTESADVQGEEVFAGAGALRIATADDGPSVVSQALSGDGRMLWMDMRLKMIPAQVPTNLPPAAAAFFFNANGYLVVCNGARPAAEAWTELTTHPRIEENTWVRVCLCVDYDSQTWDVYLNGVLAAVNLGFAAPKQHPSALVLQGDCGVLDDLYLGHTLPADLDIPERWLIESFGYAAFGEHEDPDGDGMSNRQEMLAGSNPNDPASRLTMNSTGSLSNAFTVTWQSVAGRRYTLQASTNLATGFDQTLGTAIQATEPLNHHTDNLGDTTRKFYRVILDLP